MVFSKEVAIGNKDKSISLLDSQGTIMTTSNSHSSPLTALKFLDNNLLSTADEEGIIKIWDRRIQDCVFTDNNQKNGPITCVDFSSNLDLLLCTSEGSLEHQTGSTLKAFDLRKENKSKSKLYASSVEMEEELNCLQICQVFSKG